jgi:hypothetical protein
MVSTSRIMKIGLASLAGLAAVAWQPAQAQCNTSAWTGVTGAPLASGPDATAGFIRYSGSCGLRPAAGPSFVQEATRHANEGSVDSPFRARFFAYTGISAGSPVVFRARTGAGVSVVDVTYDRTNQRFTFAPNGAAAVSTANGTAPANRWVEVRFVYQAGQPFTAQTRHLGVTTSTTPTAAVGANTVEDVQLGLVSGSATGTLFFDEYEASRALADGPTVFSLLCRGDADKSGQYELNDIFGVVDEFLRNQGDSTRARATGQPDIDQNGLIELADIFGVVDAFLAVQAGGGGCTVAANQ